jgi:hypothetical protein
MKALVLVVSGLHLGHIGCYGNDWVGTPTLDRLAAEGVVFDQHFADQPDAAGAHRAWQTGCYGFPRTVIEEELANEEQSSSFPLLAAEGVETLRASADKVRLPKELARILDRLGSCKQGLLRLDLGTLLPPWNTPDEFQAYYSAPQRAEEDDPTSACEEFEATPEAPNLELQNRYAAAVTHLDAVVAEVLGQVEQRGLLNDALVLVTTDHGQTLGEDAIRREPQLALHEEVIHIPLILRLPHKRHAGRRVSAFTQSVDLLPTLCDFLAAPAPAMHGMSLLPLATGQSDQIREYACCGLRTPGACEWALRTASWAFLEAMSSSSEDDRSESVLYVKPDDRWEVNNVCHLHLELAEHLRETLGRFVEAAQRPGPLQPPKLLDLERKPAEENASSERSNPP